MLPLCNVLLISVVSIDYADEKLVMLRGEYFRNDLRLLPQKRNSLLHDYRLYIPEPDFKAFLDFIDLLVQVRLDLSIEHLKIRHSELRGAHLGVAHV